MRDVDATLIADLLGDSLRQGNIPRLTLTSNSMTPLLAKGDQIGLEAAPVESLRPGDIVVIKAPHKLVTHRFWGRQGGQLVTRGDRSLSFDPLWAPEELVGRVILRRRAGRELSLRVGSGGWLNRRLFVHARAESRLFAGFAPSPLATQEEKSRLLGRLLRDHRYHLLPRLVRRIILTANHALCHVAGWQEKLTRRGKMKLLRITLAFTIILVMLAVLLVPWRQVQASVSLSDFFAVSGANGIILHWETVSETDTLGFNVWRGADCDSETSTRVNESLIPAQGSVATGASYSLADEDIEPGVLYHYRLEDIELNGTETCHQEPEFQLVASYDPGGGIVTATPGGGAGSGATSTSAPTDTPGPTNTPAPTNTPPSTGNNTLPTATQTAQPNPTNTPPAGNNAPPTATRPAAGDDDDADPPEPAVTGEQETEENPAGDNGAGGNDGGVGGGNDGGALTGNGSPEEVAEANAGETDSQSAGDTIETGQNRVIGEDAPLPTDESSAANEETAGGSRIILAATGLLGGLIILLGGAVAVWFLVLNRQS